MDVSFDINGMYVALQDSINAENSVKASTDGFTKVTYTLKDEISSFVSYGKSSAGIIRAQVGEVYGMIAMIDRKIANAESKRQSEVKSPVRPYISPDTPPYIQDSMMSEYQRKVNQVSTQNAKIREQNQRISNYIVQCNHAKGELNLIIGKMLGVEAFIRKETSSTESATKELWGRANNAAQNSSRINSAMSDFYHVFYQVYQAAQSIEMNTPSSVRGSFSSREFKIRNTHTHASNSIGIGYDFSSSQNSILDASPVDIYDSSEEFLIKSKDEASFFENLKNAKKFKMPSANLHKLGGKAFIAKMHELGYIAIVQANGTIIDMDGKIHWEKIH